MTTSKHSTERRPTSPAHHRPRPRRSESGSALLAATPRTYLVLCLIAVLSIFPIYWMFVIATRTSDALGSAPPTVTPGGNLGHNLSRLFANPDARFLTGLVNSAIVSVAVTISVVFFSSLAGFAFAKLRFRGRGALLGIIIATMMVPTQLGIIPYYMMMTKFGWNGHLQAVVVPAMVTGFGVFMMRQYAERAISTELIEAARVDGCSTFRIFWNVVAPALRPAAAVLALLTLLTTWNDFLVPFAVLDDPENPTVQLSLQRLSDGYWNDMSQVFAGTAVATLPLLIVFIIFGKQIIGGIMQGAVKG
jgi:cellobiose transport system permease protein